VATVRLAATKGNVVTVLGEVARPGAFDTTGNLSLIAALGMAGGWTPSAHMESVILVQQRKGLLYVNKFDLRDEFVAATQIQLASGDLVFVPRSPVADDNVFVDQYLRRNLPLGIGVGIPIN
jgi:protein involved in polysaccharide export with SLBB domain